MLKLYFEKNDQNMLFVCVLKSRQAIVDRGVVDVEEQNK